MAVGLMHQMIVLLCQGSTKTNLLLPLSRTAINVFATLWGGELPLVDHPADAQCSCRLECPLITPKRDLLETEGGGNGGGCGGSIAPHRRPRPRPPDQSRGGREETWMQSIVVPRSTAAGLAGQHRL